MKHKEIKKLVDDDAGIICVDCGSKNIEELKDEDVKDQNGKPLKGYYCRDCEAKFYPAIQIKPETTMDKWTNKIKMQEGLSMGRSWSKDQEVQYIIIRKKK